MKPTVEEIKLLLDATEEAGMTCEQAAKIINGAGALLDLGRDLICPVEPVEAEND